MLSLASVATTALLVTPAHADPAGDTFRLAWTRGQGADSCPSEPELGELVKARLGRDPFASGATRAIEGNATQADGTWKAELVVRDERGVTLGRRELSATSDDCGALTAAVSLAIVLTIDPNAELSEAESMASFPAPPPLTPAAAPPKAPAAARERAPVASTGVRCPACRVAEAGPTVSALAVGSAGLLPTPSLGAAIAGDLPIGSLGLLVGLRVLPAVDSADGHLSIGVTSGELGLCASLHAGAAALAFCALAEGGAISAAAKDLTPVSPGSYPWLALRTGPRLVWPERARLGLELALAAVVPVTRQRFRVESPENPEFQPAPVGGLLLVGLRAGGP